MWSYWERLQLSKQTWKWKREERRKPKRQPTTHVPQSTPADNSQREEEQAKKQELINQRLKVSEEITTFLNQELQLSNSELSDIYWNWPEQIAAITDLNQLNTFKEQILVDIQTKREAKQVDVQDLKNNLNKAQTGTPEEKKEALENIEKNEGKKDYEAQKEAIIKLKVEQATENPSEYSEKLIQKLTEKLTENELSETDLSSKSKTEYEKLKAGEIKDPTQLVATENSITKNIYQVKVNKELTNLITETNLVLNSNSNNKGHIEQLKSKLLAFINNNNIYYLVTHKEQIKNQLARLENYSVTDNTKTNNNLSLPIKIVIGGGVSLTIIGIVLLVLKRTINLNSRKRK